VHALALLMTHTSAHNYCVSEHAKKARKLAVTGTVSQSRTCAVAAVITCDVVRSSMYAYCYGIHIEVNNSYGSAVA
jgi:uncharacterized membrane protein